MQEFSIFLMKKQEEFFTFAANCNHLKLCPPLWTAGSTKMNSLPFFDGGEWVGLNG